MFCTVIFGGALYILIAIELIGKGDNFPGLMCVLMAVVSFVDGVISFKLYKAVEEHDYVKFLPLCKLLLAIWVAESIISLVL